MGQLAADADKPCLEHLGYFLFPLLFSYRVQGGFSLFIPLFFEAEKRPVDNFCIVGFSVSAGERGAAEVPHRYPRLRGHIHYPTDNHVKVIFGRFALSNPHFQIHNPQ